MIFSRELTRKCGLLFILLGFLYTSSAFATPARMDGLNNSPFFYDDTDVFDYPGMLPGQSNKIIVNADPTRSTGSGGVMLGRRLGVGVFVNRSSGFNDLRDAADLFGASAGITAPQRLFDLIGAFQLNRMHSIGLGLGFLANVASASEASSSSRSRRTDGVSSSTFEVMLGYSMRGRAFKLDVGLELSFNSFKSVKSDEIQVQSAGAPSLSLKARGMFAAFSNAQLAFELSVARRSYGVNVPVHSSTASYSRTIVEALVGPYFTIITTKGGGRTMGTLSSGNAAPERRRRPTRRRPKKDDDEDDGEPAGEGKDEGEAKEERESAKPKSKKGWLPAIAAHFTGGLLLGYESVGGFTEFRVDGLDAARMDRSASSLLFPGFHAALEANLGSHVAVRVGMTARYFFVSTSGTLPNIAEPKNGNEPSNTDPVTTSNTQQSYSWGAGITFSYAGFRLDGSFEAPFFRNGPNFLGGKNPGLFGNVSLSYSWH